jgi:YVTN family beta-propeller protein
MIFRSSLLGTGKMPNFISFGGSAWNVDNVAGSDFIDNLAAVFNNNRPVDQVTSLVSMHANLDTGLAGGVTINGNFVFAAPLATSDKLTRFDIPSGPTTSAATNGEDTEAAVGGGRHGGTSSGNDVIYFIPSTASSVLKVPRFAISDPSAANTTFGSFGTDANKWIGAVRAQNGKIYCIPYNAANVLVIDPSNDSTYTFGTVSSGGQKWRGGCLAPANGKIYGMPYDSDTVLVIDPATDTLTTIGPIPSVTATSARFAGCTMSTSGKLYGIPHNAAAVLAINPANDSLSVFGSLGNDAGKWEGGALCVDGKIYAAPFNSASVLVIDPFTETTSLFGSFASGGGKWRNPLLGRDGRIYMLPASTSSDLLVVGSSNYSVPRNITQSRYLNKF